MKKRRRIYFIENVKFHFDDVEGLGQFIEAEAIDESGEIDTDILTDQCRKYLSYFQLDSKELECHSYSDFSENKPVAD